MDLNLRMQSILVKQHVLEALSMHETNNEKRRRKSTFEYSGSDSSEESEEEKQNERKESEFNFDAEGEDTVKPDAKPINEEDLLLDNFYLKKSDSLPPEPKTLTKGDSHDEKVQSNFT